jgi:SAM-dependent methyltransferase
MALMTDLTQPEDITQFYDHLAGGYDAMTGFEGRFVKERPFFRLLVDNHGIRTAVDAGAGTGFHSLLLAQLGVKVTAVDISPRMLEALSRHAATMGLPVKTVAADLTDLAAHVVPPFDAVFTLGNTLAHCLTADARFSVLGGFQNVLRPGGILFAQILNYRKILVSRENILNSKEAGGYRFTRRYDYRETLIRFTITREDLSGRTAPESTSVDLYPLLETEFDKALRAVGFGDIRMFGSISMDPYDANRSNDLVILAHRL